MPRIPFFEVNEAVTRLVAGLMIFAMISLAFFSLKEDSLTFDESSHIPAGYSYISQQEYRINPEHPPLIKDLAGVLPYIFLKLNFPSDHPSWSQNVNDQWAFGSQLLYKSGNDPDKIIFLARLPMILVLLVLGIYIFRWSRELGGNTAGLLALALFSFSPTVLAHGRLVTTDVGAAAGMFIATYYFLKMLRVETPRSIIFSGVSFGLAQLIKFSSILLIPYFIFLVCAILFLRYLHIPPLKEMIPKSFLGYGTRILILLVCTFGIGYLTVGIVYQFHVWNYPPPLERHHAEVLVGTMGGMLGKISPIAVWMADKPVLRTYGEYLVGLLLVLQRSAIGNTTFFLGTVVSGSTPLYFPIVYLIKEPLALHAFTILAIISLLARIRKPRMPMVREVLEIVSRHFTLIALFLFIALYWATSLRSNLNIGIRHLLPTFPFLYVLLGVFIAKWVPQKEKDASRISDMIPREVKSSFVFFIKLFFIFSLSFWYMGSALKAYPSFISYFNEIPGGKKNAARYVVDSNLDWGQDFKRLQKFVEENNIEKIRLHYFGGADPEYYLGERFIRWGPEMGPPEDGWLAVSLTELQGRRATPAKGYSPKPEERYDWLTQEPVAIVGDSIAVFWFSSQ